MDRPEDQLRTYVMRGDEDAFAAVVEAFAPLVYGTALRRVGNAQIAEEITQNVFVTLARRAKKLAGRSGGLGGWLYRAALLESNNALRSEAARTRRMEIMRGREEDEPNSYDQAQLRETIDDVLERLSASDRSAVLLRFFEGLDFDEIGSRLGKSAGAAQKQIRRALEKLNRSLAARGVSLSVAGLGVALSAELAKASPVATSATLASNAIAATTATKVTGSVTATFLHAMNTIKTSTAVVVIIVLCALPLALQQSSIGDVRRELAEFRERERQFLSTKTVSASAEQDEPVSTPAREFLNAAQSPVTGQSFYEDFHYSVVTGDSAGLLRLYLALDGMKEEEVVAVLTELESTPGHSGVRNLAVQAAATFSEQSDTDPGGLLERQLANGMIISNLNRDMVRWAARDPESAVAWFRGHLENQTLKGKSWNSSPELELGSALAGELAKTDPGTAFAIASEVGSEHRSALVASIVDSLITAGKEDQLSGRDLAAGLNDPENVIVNAAVEAFAKNGKRERVVEFLDTLELAPREEAVALSGAIAADGGGGDPIPERMEWLLESASEGAREMAVGRSVSRIYRTDPTATSKWIDTLPDGGLRDAALTSEATVLLEQSEFSEAFGRAVLIQDQESGEMVQMGILENWARKDPAAAERAAQAANLLPANSSNAPTETP